MRAAGWGRLVWGAGLVLAAFGVLVLSVVLHVKYGHVTLERISTASMTIHADFHTFWHSARAALTGGDIYYTDAELFNLNPPFWTLIVLPFGIMEPLNAYRLFVLLMLMTFVVSLAWMANELRLRAGWAILGAGGLLFSSPLLATFALGQMYPVLALGLVAAWVADREGKHLASGVALGLVMALKPSLAPLILWPAARKEWGAVGTTIISGAAATLAGSLLLGPQTTMRYAQVILNETNLDGFWDNASLPGAAVRLFTENEFAQPLAVLPGMVPLAYALGIGVIVFTAVRIGNSSEGGLWAIVAASLLASPIAWHNYLILLAPGVLLLLARGRVALALLLLSLQFIPAQWPLLWQNMDSVGASLALTLYLYILVIHWVSFLSVGKETERSPGTTFAESAVRKVSST